MRCATKIGAGAKRYQRRRDRRSIRGVSGTSAVLSGLAVGTSFGRSSLFIDGARSRKLSHFGTPGPVLQFASQEPCRSVFLLFPVVNPEVLSKIFINSP